MKFNTIVYETINNFRIRPESYVPTLKKLKLTMSQLSKTKKNVDFVKEIDSFMSLIEKLPALQAIYLNPLLCKADEKKLEIFAKKGVNRNVGVAETKELLSEFCENYQTAFMMVNDSRLKVLLIEWYSLTMILKEIIESLLWIDMLTILVVLVKLLMVII